MMNASLYSITSEAVMAPQPSGGTSAAAKPPSGPTPHYTFAGDTRCRCCPYGFHIDLDFVKFAENVTAGTDQVQKWSTQPRRIRRRQNYSGEEPGSRTLNRDASSFDTTDEWLNTASPMESMMSQSTIGGFFGGPDDDFPTQDLPSFTNYLSKNRSDSQVARLIGELNGLENARKPPIAPPIASSTPYPEIISHRPQASWHGGNTSTNSEIHEILSRQQPTFSSTRELSKTVTSAPSSPTPVKTYHSAVAQSAARKAHQTATTSRQPIPPPRKYFDSARPRVLSPEPAVRDRNVAPTALRTSNFHSRTYYSPTTENGASSPRVPYRGGTNSSGLDFSSFASVRRQRAYTDEGRNRALSPIYNRHPGGSRLDGYASDAEHHTYRYAMSPPPVPPKTYSIQNGVKQPNGWQQKDISFDEANSFVTPVKQMAVLHQESQTPQLPELKNVSTFTDDEEPRPVSATQITQTQVDQSSVGCNTDAPPPEPKPTAPEKQYSVEFQFALGHEPEHNFEELLAAAKKESRPAMVEKAVEARKTAVFNMGMNTDKLVMVDKACMPMPPPTKPKTAEKGVVTEAEVKIAVTIETQTEAGDEEEEEIRVEAPLDAMKKPEAVTTDTQTDDSWIEVEIERRLKAEKAERKSVDKITETEEEEAGEFIMITCTKCEQTSLSNGHEHYEKIVETESEPEQTQTHSDSIGDHESGFSNSSTDLEEFEKLEQSIQEQEKHPDEPEHSDVPPEPLFRHSMPSDPEFSDHDRESLDTVSVNTMIMVEPSLPTIEEKKAIDSSKIEAIRKLLTEPSRSPFSRESGAYRSYRTEKAKTTDDLDFIADKHKQLDDTAEPSRPSENTQTALTDMVMLKKVIQLPSTVPEPVAAKIPRPKVSRYNLAAEEAETADEEDEASDRLTPLRSELRSLAAWSYGGGPFRQGQNLDYRRYAAAQNAAISRTPIEEDEVEGEIQNSGASSDSEGTYDMSDKEEPDTVVEFEMTEPLKEALDTLNEHLQKPDDVATQAVDWATRYVQHAWMKMATKRKSNAAWVEKFLDALESYPPELMKIIVNFADNNGNTALHYAVSHENYDIVSVLLDSKVCDVDKMNHAGYSPVMLGSLCEIANETQSTIIQRLFEIGNVNSKAAKHGQTALQLAASHGRTETTQLLLNCGADVNIQDIDGSSALMCASEHGHKEIAKMLLKCPNIDASLTDCDNQTALSIAVQQGHKALAVLIYAHLNFHRQHPSSDNVSAV